MEPMTILVTNTHNSKSEYDQSFNFRETVPISTLHHAQEPSENCPDWLTKRLLLTEGRQNKDMKKNDDDRAKAPFVRPESPPHARPEKEEDDDEDSETTISEGETREEKDIVPMDHPVIKPANSNVKTNGGGDVVALAFIVCLFLFSCSAITFLWSRRGTRIETNEKTDQEDIFQYLLDVSKGVLAAQGAKQDAHDACVLKVPRLGARVDSKVSYVSCVIQTLEQAAAAAKRMSPTTNKSHCPARAHALALVVRAELNSQSSRYYAQALQDAERALALLNEEAASSMNIMAGRAYHVQAESYKAQGMLHRAVESLQNERAMLLLEASHQSRRPPYRGSRTMLGRLWLQLRSFTRCVCQFGTTLFTMAADAAKVFVSGFHSGVQLALSATSAMKMRSTSKLLDAVGETFVSIFGC